MIQNSVHRCDNAWSLFYVTVFNRNNGFNMGPELLTCTHHMIWINTEHYSRRVVFQGISRIMGTLIRFPFSTCNSEVDFGLAS